MNCSYSRVLIYDRTIKLLRGLGIPASSKGNVAVAEAVYQHLLNPGMIYGMWVSHILPEVGEKVECSASAAEALIVRTAKAAWLAESCREVLGLPADAARPRARDFVMLLSEGIK